MNVLGRYIDAKAWHVVITRSGDVVRHNRFTKLAAADDFAERIELAELRAIKAWRSPRFMELDRKFATKANDRWRQQDVFGDQAAPFGQPDSPENVD